MTGFTVRAFADKAEVAFSTLVRLEASGNEIPPGNVETLKKLKSAFEKAGIEFIGSPEDGAGVRWRSGFKK
jgi:transcriptional regulator with XRE-family HTH domain